MLLVGETAQTKNRPGWGYYRAPTKFWEGNVYSSVLSVILFTGPMMPLVSHGFHGPPP